MDAMDSTGSQSTPDAPAETAESIELDTQAPRSKQQRQQLTKGMEHMRSYVVIPDEPQAQEAGQDAYGVPASIGPLRKSSSKPTQDNPQKRSDPFQFGTRYLEEGDDIFSHNAWDHVEVDAQYDDFILQQTNFQREHQVSDFDKKRFNSSPEKWWDRFYGNNNANFFKDRKWLVQEFPILGEVTKEAYGPATLLEIGAGAGNTAFPLLTMNKNPDLRLHACDYSKKAINVIQSQVSYISQPSPPVLRADVWDIASESLPPGLAPATVDIVLMIFIFSALSPDQWAQSVKNIFTLLKPGGEVLFRDYGRGDLAQVRFKKGRYLEENFYVRGDGTRVYFFEIDELRRIWSGEAVSGMDQEDSRREEEQPLAISTQDQADLPSNSRPSLEIVNLAVDRRMLVNRQRKLKMYRCWMQGRFRKRDT